MEPIAPGTKCGNVSTHNLPDGYSVGIPCYNPATHRSESGLAVCRKHIDSLTQPVQAVTEPEEPTETIKVGGIGLGRKIHLITGENETGGGGGYTKCNGSAVVDINQPEEVPHPGLMDRESVAKVTDQFPYYHQFESLCPRCFPLKKA